MRHSIIVAVVAGVTSCAMADIPRQFTYQGRLAGFADETVSLTVTFWDAQSGGTQLFTETHGSVALQDGVFSIRVGSVAAGGVPTAAATPPVWVGLAVNGAAELTPRTRLVSVPFAYKGLVSEMLVVPGTYTAAATVNPDGHVVLDGRVEVGAGTDGGGLAFVRNASDRQTIQLDGEDASSGGRIEVYNGIENNNVATVVLDGNEGNDGRVDLYDANGFEAIRLHSDYVNDAPELSLFAGTQSGDINETVQIAGNFEPDSAGAGEVRLRRVDTAGAAITTAILAATSDNVLGDPGSGGLIQLNYIDGSPVFTVKAGAGTSAVTPASMEFRDIGGNSDRRFYASPSSLSFHDVNNTQTISLAGSNGNATFTGTITTGVLTITGGSDLSEQFDIRPTDGQGADSAPQPGMVVSIDSKNPGHLVVSNKPYDRTVAGVISGAGGVKPGMMMSQLGSIADGKLPVALTGRVWVQCDATSDAIEPGDLLTSSSAAGHAMKATDHVRAQGATLGKAMTPLAAGERGLVLVLVNLQ